MTRFKNTIRNLVPAALIAFCAPAVHSQATGDPQPTVFRIEVVSRTTKAINYHHRQGSTTLALAGSAFAPRAKGEVKVDSKTGATKVEAYIEKMPEASSIAEGYLTYVLWAITPEGRAENMGELMLDGDHARLQAATELQTFGMIVTAEPYYAVTQPSDYIVMEAVVNKGTTGTIMPIDAKYELVARGGYLQQLPPADRVRLREARNIPLDLMEARQAMAVARAAGCDRYALDTVTKADIDLSNAEAFLRSGQDRKRIQTLARHVTQLAEDARLISVRRAQDESLARERSELTRTAENEAARRRDAEMNAAQKHREAVAAQQQAAETRRAAEIAQTQSAAALAEKDRQLALEAERARAAAAQVDLERTRQRMLEDEAARAREKAQAAEEKGRELEEQARAAREAAQRAEDERVKTRAELVRQLNIVLATRESARGLIVNMSDVLFDTGLDTLRPGAREKLAKVAGIILAHPGLKIEVEGHTDSTGGPRINQPLSERRAESVRNYLIAQGVDSSSITSRGFGESRPVASNATFAGRQANRRVELVVNGPLLAGTETSSTTGR